MSAHRDISKFTRQIKNLTEHHRQPGESSQNSLHQLEPQPEFVEELCATLEELHTAEEELRRQNQELAKTREALEQERQRYQELFELAPDGYVITDAYGNIREANRVAATLLNVLPKYLAGKPLTTYIAPECYRNFCLELIRLRQTDRFREWEVRIQPRNSQSFEAGLTVSAVRDAEGKLVALRWLIRDITARKQAERQVYQMQLQNLQLVEAAELKSQFLAMMSHELRTPMNSIIGFSQLLMRQLQSQLSFQQISMVECILNNGKQLLTLINNILDYTSLEAGRLELKHEIFDLNQLITTTVEELAPLVERKQLALHMQVDLKNPQVVNDSDRLRQMLVNLLTNAIKFTETGSISVEAQELEADRLQLIVKDTGVGMSESDLRHIYKLFRQLDQTIARRYGGAGLGLTITKSLVHLMGGSITVQSQLGKGSTFQIELPRQIA